MEICLQNLGAYNNGYLLYEWVELPVSDKKLEEVLDKIKVCHGDKKYYDSVGCPYEEYMIADYSGFPFNVGEYDNIEELNEFAEQYGSFDDTEKEVLEALIEDGMEIEDAVETVNRHDYFYVEGNDAEELAENFLMESGGLECLPKETLERYFDFDSYGRDMEFDYKKTANGYVQTRY